MFACCIVVSTGKKRHLKLYAQAGQQAAKSILDTARWMMATQKISSANELVVLDEVSAGAPAPQANAKRLDNNHQVEHQTRVLYIV